MKPKIIQFIGFSGSGKTTLIEKIVNKLNYENIKVATIKHDVHGLCIDREGKDSYRYSVAGACVSVVSSPDLTAFKVHKKMSLSEIISKIDGVDIITIEGYSYENIYPCISVARKETGKGVKGNLNEIIALVSDYNKLELENIGYKGVSFNLNEVEDIIKYIMGNSKK